MCEYQVEESWEDEALGLRNIRQSLGLTVEQVAKGMGMDRSTVSVWETLRSRPRAGVTRLWRMSLVRLAKERLVVSEMVLRELERCMECGERECVCWEEYEVNMEEADCGT